MPRVRIWTAPEPLIAEAVVAELREAGVPAFAMHSGTELYPSSPLTDVWVDDEKCLEDPSVQQAIKDAIDGRPLTPDEELEAEQMPFAEVPPGPAPPDPRIMVGLVIAILIVIAIWAGWKFAGGMIR